MIKNCPNNYFKPVQIFIHAMSHSLLFQTNVVIVQYDDWLIFPGDNAFEISCTKNGDSATHTASISLADPDPSAKELPKHKKSTITGDGSVVFTPDDIRPRKNKKKKDKEQKKKDKEQKKKDKKQRKNKKSKDEL